MINRIPLPHILIGLIAATIVSACGGATPDPPATQPPTPSPSPLPPTEVPTSTPLPPTETPAPTISPFIQLTFVNDTDEMVCGIFASTQGQEGELENLAGGTPLIPSGRVTADLAPDNYDILVMDCQMNQIQNIFDFELSEAMNWNLSETPAGAEPELLWINVVNNRSTDMCEFFIRPANSTEWGENVLHPEINFIISAGSSYLEWVEPAIYDLLIRDCSGNVASQLNDLEIPQNMTWTLTP
jgi:hypothetical protein